MKCLKKKIEDVCVSMDDLHEIVSVQHCVLDGFQFNIITKNDILGFYSTNKVGTL